MIVDFVQVVSVSLMRSAPARSGCFKVFYQLIPVLGSVGEFLKYPKIIIFTFYFGDTNMVSFIFDHERNGKACLNFCFTRIADLVFKLHSICLIFFGNSS